MNKMLNIWIDILKLKDWNIQIIEEKALDYDGCSKIIYNDYKAIIKIKDELSFKEKEKTLIHELLHLVHRDEYNLVSDNLDGYVETLYNQFHERNIEKMAQILYRINGGNKN